jgi:Mor family transcriptional regulator
MSYIRAESTLPPYLIEEIQKYVEGVQIYIPRKDGEHLGWGEKNGTRDRLRLRNREIRQRRAAGESVASLADSYHLSVDSIRKILLS